MTTPDPVAFIAQMDQADATARDLIDQIVVHVRRELAKGTVPPTALGLALGQAARKAGEAMTIAFTDVAGLALVRLAQLPVPDSDPRGLLP